VSIHLDQKDGEAILSVSDDGPGIPSQEFERVFKRFYRLERSRGMPGNGLGLSLVAAVARLHGASIRFNQQLAWSEGRITLPVQR
jgi:signal transduction histidine kinase